MLERFSRVKLLSYCKLLNGILNMNEQNHKFYDKLRNCLHCGTCPESFLHVVACPCPDVTAYRAQQQATLWTSLQKLRTPQIILHHIQQGILSCNPDLHSDLSSAAHVDSHSSNHSTSSSAALSQATFEEQSIHLGWDQFLRGRLSQHWKDAFHQEFLSRNRWANGTLWAGGVVKAVLEYSLSIWKYRCELLYGQTKDEAEWIIIAELHQRVTLAYEEYEKEPFIVRHNYRHLFAISLDYRLRQDHDYLQCFLSTLELAKEEREQYMKSQSENAQRFFFPRSLPSAIHFSLNFESSQLSDITGLTVLTSPSITLGSADSLCVSTYVGMDSSLDCDSRSEFNCSSMSNKGSGDQTIFL